MSFKKIIPLVSILILFIILSGFGQTEADAERLCRQGLSLCEQYRFEEAIIKFLAAADINEELGPNRREDLSYTYNQIAVCYYYLGNYGKAIEFFEQGLAIDEELGLIANIAIYLNNIGLMYYSWGQYDKAIEYHEQSLVIAEELGLKNSIASNFNNMGNVYHDWGQYDKAIEYYEQSLVIAEELGLQDGIATLSNNLGGLYDSLGQYNKAIEYYEQAMSIAEELGRIDVVATNLKGIGMVYHSWGQYDKALECYEQSLTIFKELGQQDGISDSLSCIGSVYNSWRQYDKAIEYYEQSLAIAEELGLQDSIAIDLNNIGTIYYAMENYKQAAEYFNNSISIIEYLRLTAPGAIRRDYLASQIDTYQCLICTYIRDNEPELVFDTIELSSAKYLAEQMIERIDEDTLSFEGIAYYQNNIDNNRVVINFANTDRAYLAIVSATSNNVTVVEVNKEAFISDINQEYLISIEQTMDGLRGLEITVNTDMLDTSIESENTVEFTNIVNYYRFLLSKPWLSSEEEEAFNKISTGLYALLIAPIEEELEGKTELMIITDGILGFLPFETLIMPDGRYLIEQYHIKYTQSLTVSELLANRDYSDNRAPMLAFGGAVYNETSYETDMIQSVTQLEYLEEQILVALNDGESTRSAYNELGLSNWGNLPGTLTEVMEIMNIIPNSTIYTGDDVSEYNVKQLSDNGTLRNYKVLHFATHGLVVPEIPELSAVVLSLFEEEENNEDGYLTMKEIVMLDINADFVNLSACETGLGKIYGGEGVVGLTQAFLIAGANGLSVSLWQVADESTMQFMIGMYRLVEEEGYSYDRAITEMKRRFINQTNADGMDYSKPFYWAPFVYYGE